MQIQSLYDVYQSLPDSRTASGKRFNQAGVLALITLALIAQQNSLRQITAWVAASDPALGARLGFRFNRMPSYGTIRRVLLHLDLSALRPALAQWMHTLTRTLPVSDAPPPALVPLAVEGTIITGDAHYTTREVIRTIRKKGGTTSCALKTINRTCCAR